MLRLFLSLYLLISIGLVLINLSSSFIFAKLESNIANDKLSDIQTLSQVASGYLVLLQQEQLTLTKVQQALNYPAELIATEQMAFLPEQKQSLSDGQVVSLFSDELHLLLYGQVTNETLLQIGPIKLAPATRSQIKHWLILLSYLMLALLILLWSKPLWRDLTVLIDMTEQVSAKQMELTGHVNSRSVLQPMHHALKQMTKRISELMNIQKQMIHAVSHDIRTPLARMKFSLAMINPNQTDDANVNQSKQSLLSDIQEIEELIDNLLSFGRIDSAQIELDKQDVDLSSLLNNLVDKLAPLSEKNIECDISDKIHYFCDGHFLERAIQNLIANGQKYGDAKVFVALTETEQAVYVNIEDDGAGIPEQQQESVLQPFTRLDKSRNKNSGGFGLGLAIVSRIIQWHQGQLDINNSQLGGAKVTITLFK